MKIIYSQWNSHGICDIINMFFSLRCDILNMFFLSDIFLSPKSHSNQGRSISIIKEITFVTIWRLVFRNNYYFLVQRIFLFHIIYFFSVVCIFPIITTYSLTLLTKAYSISRPITFDSGYEAFVVTKYDMRFKNASGKNTYVITDKTYFEIVCHRNITNSWKNEFIFSLCLFLSLPLSFPLSLPLTLSLI